MPANRTMSPKGVDWTNLTRFRLWCLEFKFTLTFSFPEELVATHFDPGFCKFA
jgi:hypothetical protein